MLKSTKKYTIFMLKEIVHRFLNVCQERSKICNIHPLYSETLSKKSVS